MTRNFNQFLNEGGMGVPASEMVDKKDSDDETKELSPKAKGEKKFKDKHGIKSKDHPVGTKDQFDGGTKKTDIKRSGADDKPEPGTKVSDKAGFKGKTPKRGADKEGGEKAVIKSTEAPAKK
jgi:hypothetical protein